jgi:hypothetical protein
MHRNHPLKAAGMIAWVGTRGLGEHLSQVFHADGGKGDGLLVFDIVDPETAVLRLHVGSHVPEQILVLSEDFGGAADRGRVTWCCQRQAARSRGNGRRQFQGSSAARSVIL